MPGLLGVVAERAVAVVTVEPVLAPAQAERAGHHLDLFSPGRRPPRRQDFLERGVDVVGDVEVEIAVAVGVEEGRPGRPARAGDAGPLGDLLERAVAAVAVKPARAEAGDEEIDPAVVVVIARADAAAPAIAADAGALGHVLKSPAAHVAIQGVAALDAHARRLLVKCPGVDEEGVEPAIAVVVDERRPGAGRLQKVVLVHAAAVEQGGQAGLRGRIDEPRARRRTRPGGRHGDGTDGHGPAASRKPARQQDRHKDSPQTHGVSFTDRRNRTSRMPSRPSMRAGRSQSGSTP